jgi:hypothetical protein
VRSQDAEEERGEKGGGRREEGEKQVAEEERGKKRSKTRKNRGGRREVEEKVDSETGNDRTQSYESGSRKFTAGEGWVMDGQGATR